MERIVVLKLSEKKALVANMQEVAGSALSAVVADYRGVDVANMTAVRVQAREAGVFMKVVPNRLLKLALKETDFACLDQVLVGPTIVAFSLTDPGAAARICKDFAKKQDKFTVKGLAISGQFLEPAKIDLVASLPTYDEAVALLAATLMAPVIKLVQTTNDIPGRIVRCVAAVGDQKQSST